MVVMQLSTLHCGALSFSTHNSLGSPVKSRAAPLHYATAFCRESVRHYSHLGAARFVNGRAPLAVQCRAQQVQEEEQLGLPQAEAEPLDDFDLLTSLTSAYNTVTVLESPDDSKSRFAGSRLLLLDYSGELERCTSCLQVW